MKLRAALLLVAVAVVSPELRYFQYERPVLGTPAVAAQTCLRLDAGIYAHASPGLADLRLYRGTVETPFVVRLAAPVQVPDTPISLLNVGRRGQQTVFDAAMPQGRYSDLDLGVVAQNFIATVAVSGSHAQGDPATRLGSYTIFDLTRQNLGRSTVLHLPESDFRYLHFAIAGPVEPESVTGVSVVRLPASEPKYALVAESSQVTQKNHATLVELTVPAHVPVDRVVFTPGAEPAMFSRDVSVSVAPVAARPSSDDAEPAPPVAAGGNLLRLHSTQDGHRIDEERLAVDAPRVDFNTPAIWTIRIENGDDAPLALASVRLEMEQRDLCFEAAGGVRYTLYYGDPALAAPVYDYAALFSRDEHATQAAAGPEQPNPIYQARLDERPFTEKHPALLWVALVAVIALLGGIALRSASGKGEATRPPAS
jgi:hypothetical protein